MEMMPNARSMMRFMDMLLLLLLLDEPREAELLMVTILCVKYFLIALSAQILNWEAGRSKIQGDD